MTTDLRVTRWPPSEPTPTESQVLRLYAKEGLTPYSWSNAPGDRYAAHTHSYHKVLYCLAGSITFGLPESDAAITLYPGDRLDLPPGVQHDAVVGPEGVTCLEAQRA